MFCFTYLGHILKSILIALTLPCFNSGELKEITDANMKIL